jgi:hypothetical protein
MSNGVMVLYVITAFSNDGTRIPIDSPENGLFNAYEDKATCEAHPILCQHGPRRYPPSPRPSTPRPSGGRSSLMWTWMGNGSLAASPARSIMRPMRPH